MSRMRRRAKANPVEPLPVPDNYVVMGEELVNADELQEMCKESLRYSDEPDWRKDPTYNLRRPNRTKLKR